MSIHDKHEYLALALALRGRVIDPLLDVIENVSNNSYELIQFSDRLTRALQTIAAIEVECLAYEERGYRRPPPNLSALLSEKGGPR